MHVIQENGGDLLNQETKLSRQALLCADVVVLYVYFSALLFGCVLCIRKIDENFHSTLYYILFYVLFLQL